eukprot:m.237978 g.237978  ORF g.237978 m.237978 type:complete len:468 (-) comp33717_c1_seq4:37-1440(-)
MFEGFDLRSCLVGSVASIIVGIGTIATLNLLKSEPESQALLHKPSWDVVEADDEINVDTDGNLVKPESTATWVRRKQQRRLSSVSLGSLPIPKKKHKVSRNLRVQKFGPKALYDRRNTAVEGTHQHHRNDSPEILDSPPPTPSSWPLTTRSSGSQNPRSRSQSPRINKMSREEQGDKLLRSPRLSEPLRLSPRHTQVSRAGSCPMAESSKSVRRVRALSCLPVLELIKHGKTVSRLREHGINVTSDQVEGLLSVFGKAAEEMSESDFAACFDYFRISMMEGICGEGEKKNHIFLGGACNPSTWRKEITIPMLATEGIFETDFYNPQVDNWSPNLVAIEAKAKFQSKILLFVIGEETRAIASMIEAAEHVTSANREEQTVVVVIKDVHTGGPAFADVELSADEIKDLNRGRAYLADVVSRHGCIVFQDVAAATQHIIELFHANKILDEAPLDSHDVEEEHSVSRSYSI